MPARNIFKLFDKTELNITHLFWHLQLCTPVTGVHICQDILQNHSLLAIMLSHQILLLCDEAVIIVRFHFL